MGPCEWARWLVFVRLMNSRKCQFLLLNLPCMVESGMESPLACAGFACCLVTATIGTCFSDLQMSKMVALPLSTSRGSPSLRTAGESSTTISANMITVTEFLFGGSIKSVVCGIMSLRITEIVSERC